MKIEGLIFFSRLQRKTNMFEGTLLLSLFSIPNTQLLTSVIDRSDIPLNHSDVLSKAYLIAESIVAAEKVPVEEDKGFVFQLLGCNVLQESSDQLRCSFYVTNINNSRKKLAIRTYDSYAGNTLFVDKGGQQVTASYAKLGSSTSKRSAETFLFPKTKVRLDIVFNGAPPKGTGLEMVSLAAYAFGKNGGSFDVLFRMP